jgi:hypothetical protein
MYKYQVFDFFKITVMRPKNHRDKHLVSHLVSNNRPPTLGVFLFGTKRLPFLFSTSLNPVPNAQVCAQVCVFDGTFYKITTTNYISMYPSGPWPLKILMFAQLVTREIATY